jgi:protein-tyrosine phosphatase
MAENARAALEELGVTPGEFRSRRLSKEMIEEAVLVLTATREHRAEVLREVPTAMRRTFTLREFARLVAHDDVDEAPTSLTELVTRAAAMRGQVRVPHGYDDIGDPYGQNLDVYRSCRDLIVETVDAMAPALVRAGA